jgi:hypothetical protein
MLLATHHDARVGAHGFEELEGCGIDETAGLVQGLGVLIGGGRVPGDASALPNTARPVATSTVIVRMATLNAAVPSGVA